MPERKLNVLCQFFGAFQKKKHTCGDIVASAEKVIEDYILTKNKLIHKACRTKKKGISFDTFLVITGIVAFLSLVLMIF